jgi:putative ABC transport system ATP-binding protein
MRFNRFFQGKSTDKGRVQADHLKAGIPVAPNTASALSLDRSNTSNTTSHRLIELRNVIKTYATPAGDFHALKGINLQINPGEFVAVIGKSGSGKSTLSNMITGIDRPSQGEVLVAGTPVHTLSEGQTATWRGRTIGVVFQFFQLLPSLTVAENVLLPMDFCNIGSERERRDRALELLALVEMEEHAHKLPTALSGGQQQRVAIARALSNDPPIIVADEPTGNLDSRTAEAVFHLFETLVQKGKTILMVTHDEDLAQRVTRAVTIADGQIATDQVIMPRPRPTPEAVPVTVPVTMPVTSPVPEIAHAPARHPEQAHPSIQTGYANSRPVTGAAYA